MPRASLNKDSFVKFVLMLLNDLMIHPDELSTYSKEIQEIVTKMDRRGLSTLLINFYMSHTDSTLRTYYKMLRPVLFGLSKDIGYVTVSKDD